MRGKNSRERIRFSLGKDYPKPGSGLSFEQTLIEAYKAFFDNEPDDPLKYQKTPKLKFIMIDILARTSAEGDAAPNNSKRRVQHIFFLFRGLNANLEKLLVKKTPLSQI